MTQLATRLREAWAAQASSGFLLADSNSDVETRTAFDPATGVTFRFRWLPHRQIRGDTTELERRGVLNRDRDPAELFYDPRDQSGRHCFLCPRNIAICHPKEILVPIEAGGRDWVAGANFAWLGREHFTVATAEHLDQEYDRRVLEAMLDISEMTGGRHRVVFNAAGAGATISWHLHLQIAADPLPIEDLIDESAYPIAVHRFDSVAEADAAVQDWLHRDSNHRANVVVVPGTAGSTVIVVHRDARLSRAEGRNGLVGGWEVCGDFPYSDPHDRPIFESADLDTARSMLSQVNPPGV